MALKKQGLKERKRELDWLWLNLGWQMCPFKGKSLTIES